MGYYNAYRVQSIVPYMDMDMDTRYSVFIQQLFAPSSGGQGRAGTVTVVKGYPPRDARLNLLYCGTAPNCCPTYVFCVTVATCVEVALPISCISPLYSSPGSGCFRCSYPHRYSTAAEPLQNHCSWSILKHP